MPALGILFTGSGMTILAVALADASSAGNPAHLVVGLLLVSQGIWAMVRPGRLASAGGAAVSFVALLAGAFSVEAWSPLPLVVFATAMVVVTAAQARTALARPRSDQNPGGSS